MSNLYNINIDSNTYFAEFLIDVSRLEQLCIWNCNLIFFVLFSLNIKNLNNNNDKRYIFRFVGIKYIIYYIEVQEDKEEEERELNYLRFLLN